MSALESLLDLQGRDTVLDQLRHRRAALAERAELAAADAARREVDAALATCTEARDTIAREQKRLEDEVASLTAKATSEDKKLYSGTVTAPKELQAIQDEIKALGRRRSALEDDILVQMEAAEPLDEQLADLGRRRDELAAQQADVAGRLAAAESVIDGELATVQAARDELVAGLDAGLLREYDQLRKQLGGVAVAKLEGSSCRGCHLQLSAVEVERIRKLDRDALVHCDECGRILVR